MACLRLTDLQSNPMEFLDFTSLTLGEFQHLVPPFEAAFHAHMAVWRLEVVYLHSADKYHRLSRRLSKGQKVL